MSASPFLHEGETRDEKLTRARQALQGGRLEEAAGLAREAALGSMAPDAVHILAAIALLQDMPAQAIALASRALQLHPAAPPALQSRLHQVLGRAFLREGQAEAAHAAFALAVALLPEEAAAHAGLGEAELALGAAAQASASFRHALRLAPAEPMLWFWLGSAAQQAGQLEEAAQAFGRLVQLCPGDAGARASWAAVLLEQGKLAESRELLEEADRLLPDQLPTLNNLALVLMRLGDLAGASALFDRLIDGQGAPGEALSSQQATLRLNQGTVLYERGRLTEAEALFRTVSQAEGGDKLESGLSGPAAQARFNLAAVHLARGAWQQGWEAFEARQVLADLVPQPLKALPLWDGSAGQEPVWVYGEQGLGDMVQFLRFLPALSARRPVRLWMPPDMQVLAGRVRGLDKTRLQAGAPHAPTAGEMRVSLLSLPFLLGGGHGCEPRPDPYLTPACQPAAKAGTARKRPLVGLCWSGNPHYLFDCRRSIPVNCLEPLRNLSGLRFRALQKDGPVPDWMERCSEEALASVEGFARAVEECDLVISVDTLTAHLAGALGRPLWLLNRRGGDWRWQQPHWYRDVLQFTPTEEGLPEEGWAETAARLHRHLLAWQRGQEGEVPES
ncbi:tetratricopeptide repeat protein [Oecophyllibacter saccharovorans]|uniref:tetratricopeptide repeat protein n=1 Tax=Oecophyllibacter saccharovorans TaxID=2558360 RepID=UPI001173D1E4|nr:tetratricopeptide repeat protein [Oecophyllibacter saccharovorans]TPW36716.1 tetratricopeptide repeat protein [Oecophyllibacter saccharovorans]